MHVNIVNETVAKFATLSACGKENTLMEVEACLEMKCAWKHTLDHCLVFNEWVFV